MKTIAVEMRSTLKEASLTMLTLLKIMIPISIVVKVLRQLRGIEILGDLLGPVMKMVGLPGQLGLVWATAMVTNIYGGLVAFFSMAAKNPFTVAEVTVLGTMILVAHNLFIESRIAQKAGVRLWFMLTLRLFVAFILGWILHSIYSRFGLFQSNVSITWRPGHEDLSLSHWIVGELRTYGVICLIILVLVSLMRTLKRFGVIDRLNRLLKPMLEHLGMSKAAAPITMIGMTLGVAYGGGLIINEAKSGELGKKDIFLSLSLMAMSHSLIEDTLLISTMGASLSGTLLGRVLFTIIVMYVLIRGIKRLPERKLVRYFVRG